jgi:hypothetical protein
VIKVEVPGKGDHVRSLPNRSGDMSAMFVNVNRSKRSLTLNLKSAEGVAVLKRLVATADVVVQNFRPGVVERLGIGYDDLAAANPRLVYLSMSGFGERGPGASQRVYDPLIQALTGLTTVQAGSDSERPRLIRTILPDKLSAIVAAQALTAALLARERTGQGQHIRLSMLDSVLSFLWASDMGAYTFADKPVPVEKGGSFIDLIYQTADGYMTVATNSNAEWQSLCRAVGHPEWIEDERFATPIGRDRVHQRAPGAGPVRAGRQDDGAVAGADDPVRRARRADADPVRGHRAPAGARVGDHHRVRAPGRRAAAAGPGAGPLLGDTVPDAPRGAPRLGEHNSRDPGRNRLRRGHRRSRRAVIGRARASSAPSRASGTERHRRPASRA